MLSSNFAFNCTQKDFLREQKPDMNRLYQNFPQSFYKVTRISFDIAEKTNVKLSIFDNFGREFNVLLEKEMTPGTYELRWNAAGAAPGVYYYKLIAGEYVDSKKLLLLHN